MATVAAAPGPAASAGPRGGTVRVLVIDDEEIVHWGFRLLLATQSWADRCLPARDAPTALTLAHRHAPQVALLDPGAVGGDAGCFCRRLVQVSSATSILLVTAAEAMAPGTVSAAGAAGYVSRSWATGDLLRAIRRVSLGLPGQEERPPARSPLSTRQQEILQLIADGATNGEIALRLYLSPDTVKQHTSALYRKLGARNRTHAVQTARHLGLIAV